MILQALTRYYEVLLAQGRISAPGWGKAKISFGLELAEDGTLLDVVSFLTEQARGKKMVLAPRVMEVPMPVKRSSSVAPNFLCDNSGYLLGADAKGKPQRAKECFEACRALHQRLLAGAGSPAARAVTAFFDRWQPQQAAAHPLLEKIWEEVAGGANLIFCHGLVPVWEDPLVKKAWQEHYSAGADMPQGRCLVTGQKTAIAKVHPSVKGVRDAHSSGAALVSFNAPALSSYGQEQGYNAPVGGYAAFAYTTALNTLLADTQHCQVIGDTTVVCWAEHGDAAYQDAVMAALFGRAEAGLTDTALRGVLNALAEGRSAQWNDGVLQCGEHFYVLGLAPNAARISVRFFFSDTFGVLMDNLRKHFSDIEIRRPAYDKFDMLPLWKLVDEVVNQNSRSKTPPPQLAGDLLRAILTGGPYPATLRNGVALRIRADHQVTRGRTAILKAYYRRFNNGYGHPHCPKEVLQVNGSDNTTNIPYALGRLFSVYESIQSAANPGINTTVKDKYFNSASAAPALTFPILGNLAEKHMRKLSYALRVYYSKKLGELMQIVGDKYPTQLDLAQQGSFQLGYYFENLRRYEKKTENKEVN